MSESTSTFDPGIDAETRSGLDECPRLSARFPARRGILGTLHELTQSFLALWVPGREDLTFEVLLAVQEACTNVVRHAYRAPLSPGSIAFSIEVDGDLLRVQIEDHGRPFDPSTVPPPDLRTPREGGFGVYLLRRLMSRVTYSRRGDLNRLVMEKSLINSSSPRGRR